MKINDLLLEATHPLYNTILPSYHTTVLLAEDFARAITEAALSPAQITQLFTDIETAVSSTGNNRTLIGKGVDAASSLKKIYDKLKDAVKKSGPVSGFDRAFNAAAAELKNATGGDAGVMRYIDQYRAYAKETPEAQAVLYSALVIGCGIAGYMSLGPAGAVLKPAIVGTLKFVDKLVQGEDFSTAAAEGIKTFAAAEIFRWAGGAIKTIVGGGNPVDMPSAGTTPEPTAATAVEPSTTPEPTAATTTEPDARKLPSRDNSMSDREVRAANMQQASNDMEKRTTSTPASTPANIKTSSIANATGTDILDAVNDDPKAKKVLDYLTKDINDKFAKVASGKLGSDVLQNIQKDLMKQVDTLYPDDAELFLNSGQKKQLAYQLMAKAQDSYIESSPKLSQIVNDTTNRLFDKISSGTIKSEIDIDRFIRSEILSQNPDLKNTPAITTMLTAKADSLLKNIYSDALDVDPRASKDPEWKIKAIQQYLSKKESIDFDKPALTESQVMEAFRGTMFHKDNLTEAQINKLFNAIAEGPFDTIGSAIGKSTKAIAKGKAAADKWAAGTKAGQAVGAIAKQIGVTTSNLTNKVTADKLLSAWKTAGSPTDSNAIYKLLQQQGIDDAQLSTAFKTAGIPIPAVTDTVSPQYQTLWSQVQKMSEEEKNKLINYLKQKTQQTATV